jgi:hypothetical protein
MLVALSWPGAARAQGSLNNGANHSGIIFSNTIADSWTFKANVGDSINLRLATTGFNGKLQLFDPNNVSIAIAQNSTDNLISVSATNAGTFTVQVSSYFALGSGTYVLRLAQIPEPFTVPGGDEGGPMVNGANHTGTISLGDMDMWTFAADVGDTINLRLGTTNFNGKLQLYDPYGDLVATAQNATDNLINYTAGAPGTYTVLVSSYFLGQSGTYVLRLAELPEPFIVPAGDEGGPLTNNIPATGTITLADIDRYTFTASAGDVINLRLGTTNFNGRLELYNPYGDQVATALNTTDGLITYTADAPGTYSVLVSSYFENDVGTYVLRLAQVPKPFTVSPGDEGGGLVNGSNRTGRITLADIDMWSFDADTGDTVNLRLGTTNFNGKLELYDPFGIQVATAENTTDGLINYVTDVPGSYTVLVSSYFANGVGTYVLRMAQIPEPFIVPVGDEGGPLTNDIPATGTITLADIDMWTFSANTADTINLRLGTTNFNCRLELYDPYGALVATALNTTDGLITYTAGSPGTYTVLVSSYFAAQTGTYVLRLAQVPKPFAVAPGEEGGSLTNGANHTGAITLGDMDMWTLNANVGDTINLRLGTTGFNGKLQLYSPQGVLVATTQNSTDDLINYAVSEPGTYTVLVSSYSAPGTGTYVLRLAQVPEPFIVPGGDEGGPLTNGVAVSGTNALADMDMWAFAANTGDNINLRLLTTNYNGKLELYGPYGAALAIAQNATSNAISYTASVPGVYTVVVSSYFAGGTGTYGLLPRIPNVTMVAKGLLDGRASYFGTVNTGDVDAWTFNACVGEPIRLHLQTTNFNGKLQLFGLKGVLLAAAVDASDLSIAYTATNCGPFTVQVASYFSVDSGSYGLSVNGLANNLRLCAPLISGTNVSVAAVGGTPGNGFTLRGTTNLAMPFGSWTAVWTNQFDQNGVFTYSNSFSRGRGGQFYRFRVP